MRRASPFEKKPDPATYAGKHKKRMETRAEMVRRSLALLNALDGWMNRWVNFTSQHPSSKRLNREGINEHSRLTNSLSDHSTLYSALAIYVTRHKEYVNAQVNTHLARAYQGITQAEKMWDQYDDEIKRYHH